MPDRDIPTIDAHDGTLRCPRCGEYYLHQCTTEVFERSQEDGPVRAVLLEPGAGPRNGDPDRNPSERRQGLLISFRCEVCGFDDARKALTLEVYQHKGATYLRWREF